MEELYKEYKRIQTSDNLEDRINNLNDIIRQYPKLMDYVTNKVDSCFGTHRVYVIHLKVNNTDVIKIGYTKNNVKKRFSEKRYAGSDKLEIVEILREEELQAKGAVEFEKKLKDIFKGRTIKTSMTLPGKGELFNLDLRDEILEMYDNKINDYKKLVGLKSPN